MVVVADGDDGAVVDAVVVGGAGCVVATGPKSCIAGAGSSSSVSLPSRGMSIQRISPDLASLDEREVDRRVWCGRQDHANPESEFLLVGERSTLERDDVAVDPAGPADWRLSHRVAHPVGESHVELYRRGTVASVLDGEADGNLAARLRVGRIGIDVGERRRPDG